MKCWIYVCGAIKVFYDIINLYTIFQIKLSYICVIHMYHTFHHLPSPSFTFLQFMYVFSMSTFIHSTKSFTFLHLSSNFFTIHHHHLSSLFFTYLHPPSASFAFLHLQIENFQIRRISGISSVSQSVSHSGTVCQFNSKIQPTVTLTHSNSLTHQTNII